GECLGRTSGRDGSEAEELRGERRGDSLDCAGHRKLGATGGDHCCARERVDSRATALRRARDHGGSRAGELPGLLALPFLAPWVARYSLARVRHGRLQRKRKKHHLGGLGVARVSREPCTWAKCPRRTGELQTDRI